MWAQIAYCRQDPKMDCSTPKLMNTPRLLNMSQIVIQCYIVLQSIPRFDILQKSPEF
jgi:hypothetical protein